MYPKLTKYDKQRKADFSLARKTALVSVLLSGATAAQAQFSPPADQGFTNLLGTQTAGSETGIFELVPLITSAGLAIVTLTIVMVGIVFTRKVVRKFTG